MSCEQYESVIGDLVDGTLDGAPRHELENHLATCAACTRLAEDLLVVRRAARALPPLELPSAGWARVSAAIEAEPAELAPKRWQRWVLPLAAAAVLVAAVAVTVTWRRTVEPTGLCAEHRVAWLSGFARTLTATSAIERVGIAHARLRSFFP